MPPRIVFHHVPKCAGTTVLKFLEGMVPPERAAFLEALLAIPDPQGIDRVAALLRGSFIHDPFGVHDWKSLFGDVVEVIFLRDPVERLWSEWRMIARWDDGLLATRDERYRRLRDVARAGFGDFLALPGTAAFANALAYHLACGEPLIGHVRLACSAGQPPAPALIDCLDFRLAARSRRNDSSKESTNPTTSIAASLKSRQSMSAGAGGCPAEHASRTCPISGSPQARW